MAEIDVGQQFITPLDTIPTDGPEAETYWTILRSVPETLRDVMSDVEVAEFINTLKSQYNLDFVQRWLVAEFLRDILMGISLPQDLVDELAEHAGVRKTTSTQIIKEIEANLLSKIGMSIADIAKTVTGPAIRQEAGRILLRYNSIDDLLASIEDMPSDERTAFLEDAKTDNRIMVLKALSQLKLGVDGKGKPMTFRQLALKEVPDFSGRDWIDAYQEDRTLLTEPQVRKTILSYFGDSERIAELFITVSEPSGAQAFYPILSEALGRAKPSVTDYVRWSPYFAGLFDKNHKVNERLLQFFVELEPEIKEGLITPETSNAIEDAIRENIFPKNYGVAVAKIIFMVSVGDLGIETLPTLLSEKLGLGEEQGMRASEHISTIIEAIMATESIPEEVLTPQEEEKAEEPPQKGSAKSPRDANIDTRKNVVDLRKANSEG